MVNSNNANQAVVTTANQTQVATAIAIPQTTPPSATSVALKSGPDVTLTLNRINTTEHEVDVEECLPADVVKLDFAGEEVAG